MENVRIEVDGEDAGTFFQPNVDVLLSHATPAPFGQGTESVLDSTIRSALEIPAARLKLEDPSANHAPFALNVTRHAAEIVPPLRRVSATLYKMHLYKEGGHFEVHRDTVHDAEHAATAVLQLGSRFTGGDLVLMGVGKDDFGEVVRKEERLTADVLSNEQFMFGLATFYTDIPHCVEPVTSGVRVVLQYDLQFSKTNFQEYSQMDCYTGEPLVRQEAPLLQHAKTTMPTATTANESSLLNNAIEEFGRALTEWRTADAPPCLSTVVFLLDHQYGLATLEAGLLRGNDHMLREGCLASEDAWVELVPLLVTVAPHRHDDEKEPSLSCGVFFRQPERVAPNHLSRFLSPPFPLSQASFRLSKTPVDEVVVFSGGLINDWKEVYRLEDYSHTGNEPQVH